MIQSFIQAFLVLDTSVAIAVSALLAAFILSLGALLYAAITGGQA